MRRRHTSYLTDLEPHSCFDVRRARDTGRVIDDGYLEAVRLLEQLRVDLDGISNAEPGTGGHRRAITSYTATYAKLGRVAFTKHAPFPIPEERTLPE